MKAVYIVCLCTVFSGHDACQASHLSFHCSALRPQNSKEKFSEGTKGVPEIRNRTPSLYLSQPSDNRLLINEYRLQLHAFLHCYLTTGTLFSCHMIELGRGGSGCE